MAKRKKKRTQEEIDNLASSFIDKLDWIETSWGVKTEGEVDLSTGRAWLKITKPGELSGIYIECDADDFRITG